VAKRHIYNACDALYDYTHTCDKACSLCTATPPCTNRSVMIHATGLFSVKSVQNHLTLNAKGKLVCQWRQVCRNCNFLETSNSKHECFKKFCNYCNKNNIPAIFATWLHSNLANFQSDSCTFSLTWSVRKIWKDMKDLSNMYRTLFVLSKCVQSLKLLRI
jgi:hypothetical protein